MNTKKDDLLRLRANVFGQWVRAVLEGRDDELDLKLTWQELDKRLQTM